MTDSINKGKIHAPLTDRGADNRADELTVEKQVDRATRYASTLQNEKSQSSVRQVIEDAPPISPTHPLACDSISKDYALRSKRRKFASTSRVENAISSFLANQFLAPLIIVIGGFSAFFFSHDNLSSTLVTLMTACLASLVYALRKDPIIRSREEKEETLKRFEALEDKAWELSESEERYRNIAEAFGDMLMIRDEQNKILFCNPAYAMCFGKSVEEITGTDYNPLPKFTAHSKLGLGRGTSEVAYDTDQGLKWFSWLDLPVKNFHQEGDDSLAYSGAILSVARDITNYKSSEQTLDVARDKAEQANRAKSRFLAMVSHEMRTPLNGVLGMSKLLDGTNITPEQKAYIDSIHHSGSSLLSLIEDMLDLTMIEAGRFKLQEQEVDLRQLLSDVVELMSSRAYPKNIGLGLFIDKDIPKIFFTDKMRLQQVVMNLVGNAIKFTHKGGVALHCEMSDNNSADQKARIVFKVVDTGPGLNSEDQKRIFQEFERVDDENTRNVGGAGLGLAISKAIVDQMDGTLSLQQSSEKGSTFKLELTVKYEGNNEAQYEIADSMQLDGKSILLGMNNLMEANCLIKQIEMHGGKVLHCTDLSQLNHALENEKTNFHSAILDMQSIKNVEQIVIDLEAKTNLRVIVLTEPATRHEMTGHIENGADAYLIRPIREASLISVLTDKMGTNDTKLELSRPELKSTAIQPLTGVKVLLAEDNAINKMLVTASLSKAGANVTHAQNGALAVDEYKSGEFDIVLMDMHMPVMDGVDATLQIRKFEKETSKVNAVKILALTADDQESSRQEAFSAGMDSFLQKPIDPVNLVNIVEENTIKNSSKEKQS